MVPIGIFIAVAAVAVETTCLQNSCSAVELRRRHQEGLRNFSERIGGALSGFENEHS
jgi:hypothetical protein